MIASVSLDTIKAQISILAAAAKEIERTRQAIMAQYQQLGNQWNDTKYKYLGGIVRESDASLRKMEIILLEGQKKLWLILKAVSKYEQVSLNGTALSGMPTEGYSGHLSPNVVNTGWESAVNSIDEVTANFKEALLARGVPECEWLIKKLNHYRLAMLRHDSYCLNVASGHPGDPADSVDPFHGIIDYEALYDQWAAEYHLYCDQLAAEFQYCLNGTNPRYQDAPEWMNNCQRCVPAYELRRRGSEITVRPSTYGSYHLAYRPFDVWDGAEILTCIGNGNQTIQNSMAAWGDGSRAQIAVYWDSPLGGGHTFMAEQQNGTTVFFDPQTGNSDCSSYFDRVIDGRTQFCRIDNLEFSPYIEECYMEVGRND